MHWPVLLLVLVLSGGCSSLLTDPEIDPEASARELYNKGEQALEEGYYERAIERFETLQGRYPFGRYAKQAQLELIYAYYKFEEPASAIAAADRFIKLHPRHPHVAYAYYMKGVIHAESGKGLLDRFLPKDPTRRDPTPARKAFQDFAELVRRFPETDYAQEAVQRMVYLRNNLARHELHVAHYYLKRGAYVAAANRAQYILKNYPRSIAIPQALAVMCKTYKAMGLESLYRDTLRVLRKNHPFHPATDEARRLAARGS